MFSPLGVEIEKSLTRLVKRENRRMRIRLRLYHPTYVIGYFGQGYHPKSYNSQGFNEVIEKIKSDPNIEIELVEEYDDICMKCKRLVEDENGSVWGKRHSCSSSKNPSVVEGVNKVNKRVLRALGLKFGSVVKLRDLVKLLSEKIPILDDDMIGGQKFQEKYDKGLTAFSKKVT